jgi:hypothetical protein
MSKIITPSGNFSVPHGHPQYWMKAGPLRCGLNTPEALKSVKQGDDEFAHGLPPYHGRKHYLVDRYPACPKTWPRSSGALTSYMVPVEEGRGMWLDFNDSLNATPHHMALVVSVQGVNAVTGLPAEDTALEQYLEKCPKHKVEFGPHRFCKQCNFQWPKQNYITTAAQPLGQLWIDGFRAVDGVVRQYVLTAEKARGVATTILGEQRVYAIGVSCFLSKAPRPSPGGTLGGRPMPGVLGFGPLGDYEEYGGNVTYGASLKGNYTCDSSPVGAKGVEGPIGENGDPSVSINCSTTHLSKGGQSVSVKSVKISAPRARAGLIMAVQAPKLEVAAGARIDQRIHDDPNGLDFWQDKHEALLVINYCSTVQLEAILAAGEQDVTGSQEGFLQKVPVGH